MVPIVTIEDHTVTVMSGLRLVEQKGNCTARLSSGQSWRSDCQPLFLYIRMLFRPQSDYGVGERSGGGIKHDNRRVVELLHQYAARGIPVQVVV